VVKREKEEGEGSQRCVATSTRKLDLFQRKLVFGDRQRKTMRRGTAAAGQGGGTVNIGWGNGGVQRRILEGEEVEDRPAG